MKYVFKKKWKRALMSVFDAVGRVIYATVKLFRRKPLHSKKILVLRLDQMGDVIQAVPFFTALRRKYPGAEIAALVVNGNEPVLSGNPAINKIYTVPGSWFYPEKTAVPPGKSAAFAEIRHTRYDLGFDLRGDLRNINFLRAAGVKWLVGYDSGGGGFLLDDQKKYDRDAHEIAKNLALIDESPSDEVKMEFAAPAGVRNMVDMLLSEYWAKKIITVHPFTRVPAKMWGVAKFSNLINIITGHDKNAEIFVIGSKDEEGLSKQIEPSERVHNMTGKLGLQATIELVKRSSVFIGSDSGPQYFAAYSGVKTCVIYGFTVNTRRWRPLVNPDNFIGVSVPVACGPCESPVCLNKDGGHSCMDAISVSDVFEAVKGWV